MRGVKILFPGYTHAIVEKEPRGMKKYIRIINLYEDKQTADDLVFRRNKCSEMVMSISQLCNHESRGWNMDISFVLA